MEARSVRIVTALSAAAAAVVVAGFIAAHFAGQLSAPVEAVAPAPQELSEESLPPSLDCAFHDMMRTHAIVSFYFDVVIRKGEAPRFYQRAVISEVGTRTDFAGDRRPVWTYGPDGDGKPMITSSDGATRIVLYGLKLGVPGIFSVEAGIRSNAYRNMGGECRQTNLGVAE